LVARKETFRSEYSGRRGTKSQSEGVSFRALLVVRSKSIWFRSVERFCSAQSFALGLCFLRSVPQSTMTSASPSSGTNVPAVVRRSSSAQRMLKLLESIPEEKAFEVQSHTTLHQSKSSFLTLANYERRMKGLSQLKESTYLNALAYKHAQRMAEQGKVFRSFERVEQLERMLLSHTVGENVLSGDSVLQMHFQTMHQPNNVNRANVVGALYTEFGSATVKNETTGKLFACQFFRTTMDAPTMMAKPPQSSVATPKTSRPLPPPSRFAIRVVGSLATRPVINQARKVGTMSMTRVAPPS